jgi:hypothetical protein
MSQEVPTPDELKEAYRTALAARDLEINQLVQRNNFFMIFQGVLLAGLLQASGNTKIIPVVAFLVCACGLCVSILQVMMASGAKFWQERWEQAVEDAEARLFPKPEPEKNASLFRVFSAPPASINAIVDTRMRGKRLEYLVTARFSPSRLPVYAALAFALIWFLLLLCTLKPWGPFGVPSWITGFA